MASRKTSSKKKTSKAELNEELERAEAFKKEAFLWIIVAISVLLFISNFGIGGKVGGAVSDFFFGVFGLCAFIIPIVLLVASFFAVSNKGNSFAIIKLIAALVFVWFICVFMYLATYSSDVVSPAKAFAESANKHSGGGLFGAIIGFFIVPAFGTVGAYVIDIVILIICIVFITGKSVMKGMRDSGQKVYESAKETADNNRKRRMDKKVSGVSLDTKIVQKDADTQDEMGEIHAETYPSLPEIKEKTVTNLTAKASDSDDVSKFAKEVASEDVTSKNNFEQRQEKTVDDETNSISKIAAESEIPIEGAFSSESKKEVEKKLSQEIRQLSEPIVADKTIKTVNSAQESNASKVDNAPDDSVSQMLNTSKNTEVYSYKFPTASLLKPADKSQKGNSADQLRATAAKLEQTLQVFGVDAKVNNISCGPAVTRFEITPPMGVKVSKIVNLADDIKLNLAAADIRIEAPIPGKAAVGIEVPNSQSVMVPFRELIESDEFKNASSKITFAVGKDIAGKVKVTDIAKMPHLLIAGATGSGKSVCINTIIMSILYKARPDEVKLIMIDPKVVELSVYNGIPHLMIPVVTDPKKAAGALNWAVAEMTDRYQKFAENGVRDINGYNSFVENMDCPQSERPQKMPKIVIIVDELADLMMVASKDVEEAICRLAQLARAAGIHLIIATQRPSVNVITGLIKANMPSRIAFAVTSGVDSRTILDMNGAEKLLGKGDMLFDPQGAPKPLRVQGAFVSDKEVSDIVSFIVSNNENAQYSSDVQEKMESMANTSSNSTVSISSDDDFDDGRDSYFSEAALIITDKERASIGMLQRYLKVGFNRAARIMDQLEEAGIVGPEEGTKPRKVLVNKDELDAILSSNN